MKLIAPGIFQCLSDTARYAPLVHTYRQIAEYPVLAVAAGSIAVMTINLLTSKYLLFRFHR